MPGKARPGRPQPIDVHVGTRIRVRRRMLGISLREMAGRIGISSAQLQKYERGINRIGASRLLPICVALKIAPACLFEGVGGPKSASTGASRAADAANAAFLADKHSPQLILVWNRLPAEIKRSMLALMQVAAEKTINRRMTTVSAPRYRPRGKSRRRR